jgi:hypothetical protein
MLSSLTGDGADGAKLQRANTIIAPNIRMDRRRTALGGTGVMTKP